MTTAARSTALVTIQPAFTVGDRTDGPIFLAADGRRLDRHGAGRIVRRVARRAGITKNVSLTRSDARSSRRRWMPGCRCATSRKPPHMLIREPRCDTTGPAAAWTCTPLTLSPPTSRVPPGKPALADSNSAWRPEPPGGQACGHPMTIAARTLRTATSTRTGTAYRSVLTRCARNRRCRTERVDQDAAMRRPSDRSRRCARSRPWLMRKGPAVWQGDLSYTTRAVRSAGLKPGTAGEILAALRSTSLHGGGGSG